MIKLVLILLALSLLISEIVQVEDVHAQGALILLLLLGFLRNFSVRRGI